MTETERSAELKPWNEPRVEVLDVAESEMRNGMGHDGSSFPNSTRS